jgi:hypothetical protein
MPQSAAIFMVFRYILLVKGPVGTEGIGRRTCPAREQAGTTEGEAAFLPDNAGSAGIFFTRSVQVSQKYTD